MADHARREQLIGFLRGKSVEVSQVHRAPEAERAATELRQLLEGRPLDLDALAALGWHHWIRQCTLPQSQASSDEAVLAAQALVPCFLLRADVSDLPATALSAVVENIADPVAVLIEMGIDPGELQAEQVAELWTRMVAATPPMSLNLVPRLAQLFEVAGSLDDGSHRDGIFDLFVNGVMQLSRVLPPTHPNWAPVLHLSGSAAFIRHSEKSQAADLEAAIDRTQQVARLVDQSNPLWAESSLMLGCALLLRADDDPQSSDPREALRILRELDSALDSEDPARPADLTTALAVAQGMDALRREDFTALLAAMDRVDLADAPELSALTVLLAEFSELFEGTLDDKESLAQAERFHRRLLTTLDDGRDRAETRLTLAWLLSSQAEGGNLPGLDEAIILLEENMSEAPEPDIARRTAQTLAMAYHQRHGLRDDPADLDKGVRLAAEFGAGSSPSQKLLRSRFEKASAARDPASRGAIQPADVFDSDFRFSQDAEHMGSMLDIVSFIGPASDIMGAGVSPHVLQTFEHLTETLMSVSDVNDPAPFDNIIGVIEAAVDRLPDDSPERPAIDLLLLSVQGVRAAAADDSEATGEFIRRAQDALNDESLTAGVSRVLQALVSHSTKLRAMWELQRDGRVSTDSREYARRSVAGLVAISLDDTNTASQRIDAARQAAELAHRAGQVDMATGPLATAVTLLPEAAPWHVRPDRRRRHFRRFTGLTSEAVALTLAGDDTARADETALRLLEAGRGVLHHQIISSRSDQPELRRAAPELAEEYKSLISQLSQDDSAPDDEAEPEWRHLAAERLKHVEARIRRIDGFTEFGGPPPIEQLRSQATHGPIVALNLSRHGCHALIVTPEGIERVPLPRVNLAPATRYVNDFVIASGALYADPAPSFDQFSQHRDTIRVVLSWAHHAITNPILDRLGYEPTDPANCPRLWWAPGGMLGLLPLHAAGDYSLDRPVITADRVVSSYTPTIAQLRHVRAAGRDRLTPPRGFAVAMSNTPALRPLPEATAEVAALRAIWPRLIAPEDVLIDGQAERDAVIDRLNRVEIAHFACHAITDPTDPAASRIVLHDHGATPLTVAELSRMDIANGRLAYLSACRTAHSSDGVMLDESLHLAAACQVGGFEHVIGTLWPVADDIAADFAARCYRAMTTDRAALNPSLSARAVHLAMTELRDDLGPKSTHLWAPWVHYGA